MPEYDFGYDYGGYTPSSGVAGAVAGVFVAYYLILIAIGVVSYVFRALSLYTISKRRGIHNPWLSWIPVGDMWILGSISDQYQYVVKGKVRNRRKVLLGFTIALLALVIVMYISLIAMLIQAFADPSMAAGIGSILQILLAALGMIAVSIAAIVYQYLAVYDLFCSCEPNNAVLFLVLSILFGFLEPIFLLIGRKKDLGMPPRKPQPAPAPLQMEEPATEEN